MSVGAVELRIICRPPPSTAYAFLRVMSVDTARLGYKESGERGKSCLVNIPNEVHKIEEKNSQCGVDTLDHDSFKWGGFLVVTKPPFADDGRSDRYTAN